MWLKAPCTVAVLLLCVCPKNFKNLNFKIYSKWDFQFMRKFAPTKISHYTVFKLWILQSGPCTCTHAMVWGQDACQSDQCYLAKCFHRQSLAKRMPLLQYFWPAPWESYQTPKAHSLYNCYSLHCLFCQWVRPEAGRCKKLGTYTKLSSERRALDKQVCAWRSYCSLFLCTHFCRGTRTEIKICEKLLQ